MRRYRLSFIVDAENHARAEKRGVAECEAGIIIVGVVPETLRGDTDTLAGNLSDNSLHYDFVGGDAERLDLHLDLIGDQLSHHLRS